MNGWNGYLLRVDLTAGRTNFEYIDSALLRDYLGGRGLAARYLMDEMDPRIEPLSPRNKLIMAAGPLTGTPVPTGARYMIVTKSPLTGALTCSNSGGCFPTELKKAGLDLIIIQGRAASPVYLWVNDGRAELRSAGHLWGMRAPEADQAVRAETDLSARVALIGPAGENLSLISAVMNDRHRAAGRAGVGAVMGSKNLKAVAVKGSGRISLADEKNGQVHLQDRSRRGQGHGPGRQTRSPGLRHGLHAAHHLRGGDLPHPELPDRRFRGGGKNLGPGSHRKIPPPARGLLGLSHRLQPDHQAGPSRLAGPGRGTGV